MSIGVIKIPKGDSKVIRYQIKEDGVAKNIAGMSFYLSVKEDIEDTTYKIGPVEGDIDVEAEGKFSFTLNKAETNIDPFLGVFAVVMVNDASGEKTTLTPVGGSVFELYEDIYDVS